MKKQLSCVFLAVFILAFNALPTQAANKNLVSNNIKQQLVLFTGKWCFFNLSSLSLSCPMF